MNNEDLKKAVLAMAAIGDRFFEAEMQMAQAREKMKALNEEREQLAESMRHCVCPQRPVRSFVVANLKKIVTVEMEPTEREPHNVIVFTVEMEEAC